MMARGRFIAFGCRSVTLLLLAAWLVCATPATAAGPASSRKIVLIAGPLDSHPRETHEYEKNVILLKHCLDTSPDFNGATVEAHFNGWPANPSTLDDADTILLTSGGSDRKETDHPLYVGDRFEQLARQMDRGCGLVFFHWSTFHPVRKDREISTWVGGYFDYETGTNANKWYSAIQTREWMTALADPEHPIARGVRPFKVTEEFYFNIRFSEGGARLRPILLKQSGGTLGDAVAWAAERFGGGRGFGFTGGHFYKNWWLPDFRRLVLNAVAWTARLEVPAGGVRSELGDRFRALIVTGHNHPAHEWRSTTAALLHVLEQDPRALVEVTENPEDLASPKLHEYPLLVLNYCNWQRPGLSDAAKTNLTRYLSNGGGLAVIHFANGAFHRSLPGAESSDWPEYRRIVRRVWDHQGGSGHDAFGPFRVDITSAAHPITRGLAAFETVDELYFKQAGDEPIEPLATARSRITGRDEPMAWAYSYGRGRVFQTVLGHAEQSIRKAAPLIRRGSVWAAGYESLSFDPPPELVERAAFRAGSPWTPEKLKPNK